MTTGIVNSELAEIVDPAISGLVVTLGNHLLEDGSDIVLPDGQDRAGGAPDAPAAGRLGAAP